MKQPNVYLVFKPKSFCLGYNWVSGLCVELYFGWFVLGFGLTVESDGFDIWIE